MKTKISIIVAIALQASAATTTLNSTETLINTYTNTISVYQKNIDSLNSSIKTYQTLISNAKNASTKTLYQQTLNSLNTSLKTNQTSLLDMQNKLNTLKGGGAIVQSPTVVVTPPVTQQPDKNTTTPVVVVDPLTIPNTITNKPVVPTTSSLEYKNTKSFQYTGVETAWNQGFTGTGVTVGVLDTGLTPYNDDISRFFSTNNIIEFINVYNPKTKEYVYTKLSGGMVAYIRLNANNDTFTTAPTITITGNGTGATAVAIMNGNKIQSIQITNPGKNYSGLLGVTITDSVTGQKITTTTATGLLAGYDMRGHGSAVTSLIAGANNSSGIVGMAFDSNVVMVKVSDLSNNISEVAVTDGARAAGIAGAKIINQSLETYSNLIPSTLSTYTELTKSGITIVTAAGNSSKTCNTLASCNQLAAMPLLQGGSEIKNSAGGWIVVGALNADGTDIASWSNRAGLLKDYYILAPGTNVGLANFLSNTNLTGSGTSFAAPIVAGAMALLQQKWSKLSGAQQAQILFQTADDMGVKGVDDVYGWGKMNLTKAFSPIGDLVVPTALKTKTGLSSATTLSVYKTSVSGSSLVTAKLASFKELDATVGFDSFERNFNVNITNNISITKPNFSFDQFLTIPVSKDGKWIVGANKLYDAPMVGYKFNKNITTSYSMVKGYFGSIGKGALEYDGTTHYVNIDYNNISNNTGIELSGTYGYAVAKNSNNSMISMSDAQSIGLKAKAIYNGLGIIANIPGKIINGKSNATIYNSEDINIPTYLNASLDMSKGAYEKQYGLVYQNGNFNMQIDKTIDQYNIAKLNSTNLRINVAVYY